MNIKHIFGNRKAQITLFIIIGIVVLIGGTIIYTVYNNLQETNSEQLLNKVTKVTAEAKPFQEYVHSCLKQTGKEAVVRIMQNGGYMNPLDNFDYDFKTEKSQLILYGGNQIPYWYYYDDDNGFFSSKTPWIFKEDDSLYSLETQIELYVEENIDICLKNFKPFRSEFSIHKDDDKDVVATINDDGIVFELYMPMTLKSLQNDREHKIEYFGDVLEAPIKKLYYFALDILSEQQISSFLERSVLELLSMQSGIGQKLPPKYDISIFTSTTNTWFSYDVKNIIHSEILPIINRVQVANTYNHHITYSNNDALIKTSLDDLITVDLLDPRIEDYSDLSVNFFYPMQVNPYIKVGDGKAVLNPKTSSTIDDDSFFTKLFNFAMNIYRFNYDMTFPVVSRICDPMAFNGEGLCFFIAIEGNIRLTKPFGMYTQTPLIFKNFKGSSETKVDLGSELQKVNKIIEFGVYDARTLDVIKGANIYYKCGKEYYVGSIEKDEFDYKFSGKMPFCASGGQIIIRKAGYLDAVKSWNNFEDSDYIELDNFALWPYIEIPVRLRKKIPPIYWSKQNLNSSDLIIMEITKIKEISGEPNFPMIPVFFYGQISSSSLSSSSDFILEQLELQKSENLMDDDLSEVSDELEELILGVSSASETNTDNPNLSDVVEFNDIMFVPGEYNIKYTYVMNGESIVHIDSEHKRICLNGEVDDNGFCLIQVNEYDIPELNLDTWLVSSYEQNISLGVELYDYNNITLYLPDIGTPKTFTELETYDSKLDKLNDNQFRPTFE